MKVEVAVFDTETNKNLIREGEGFTIIEAIVRAVEYYFETEEEIQSLIRTYGPDDTAGLQEHYENRGIYISDPNVKVIKD